MPQLFYALMKLTCLMNELLIHFKVGLKTIEHFFYYIFLLYFLLVLWLIKRPMNILGYLICNLILKNNIKLKFENWSK